MMTQYDDGFVWFGLFGFVQVLVFVWFAWFNLDRFTNREFKFSTIHWRQCGWVEELEIMIANTVTSGCHCHHDCCQPQAEAEAYDSELP